MVKRLRARKCELDIPWRYSAVVHELLDKEFALKAIDLDITTPEHRETDSLSPIRTSPNLNSPPVIARTQSNWTIKPRYDDTDKRVCTWLIWLDRADITVTKEEVQSTVQSALSQARKANCVGILTAVDRQAFGIVCGRFKQNLWEIEEGSNTSIIVPGPTSSEKEIVIKGDWSD